MVVVGWQEGEGKEEENKKGGGWGLFLAKSVYD